MCVHVCQATGQHFRAAARLKGTRRHMWTWLGPKRKQESRALNDLATYARKHEGFANGVVMLCADWYDPIEMFILRRVQ